MTKEKFPELLDAKLFDDKVAEVCKNVGDHIQDNIEDTVPPLVILAALARLVSINLASYQVIFDEKNIVEKTLAYIKEGI